MWTKAAASVEAHPCTMCSMRPWETFCSASLSQQSSHALNTAAVSHAPNKLRIARCMFQKHCFLTPQPMGHLCLQQLLQKAGADRVWCQAPHQQSPSLPPFAHSQHGASHTRAKQSGMKHAHRACAYPASHTHTNIALNISFYPPQIGLANLDPCPSPTKPPVRMIPHPPSRR